MKPVSEEVNLASPSWKRQHTFLAQALKISLLTAIVLASIFNIKKIKKILHNDRASVNIKNILAHNYSASVNI